MVVAADAPLRLQLRRDLQPFADLQIVAEAKTTTDALSRLGGWVPGAGINVVLVDFALNEGGDQPDRAALRFCQQLTARSPTLPVVLLTPPTHPHLAAAFHQGIAGGWVAGSAVSDLITTIRRVAAGQRYWPPAILPGQALTPRNERLISSDALNWVPNWVPTTWHQRRRQLRLQGLEQIDAALMALALQLRSPNCTTGDRWFLQGRQRELRAARWVVQRLLATPGALDPAPRAGAAQRPIASPELNSAQLSAPLWPTTAALGPAPVDITSSGISSSGITPKVLQSRVFDAITAKLQASLDNGTNIPLEIDFFKESKKRQLFYIILRQVEALLAELRFSQVASDQFPRSLILLDLWQATLMAFFGKYYTVPVNQQPVAVVTTLLQSQDVVQAAILDQIPLVPELLGYLVWQTPLTIDEVVYPADTPLATERATALLENLTIQMACAIVQPLLNAFSDNEVVKQEFYDRRLLSTREIERFRNDLSWKYRIAQSFSEPQAIFESRYWLWRFTDLGLRRSAIYAPRGAELDRLGGAQLAVTLLLESRDAVVPRLSAAMAWVGRGVVYLLTEIIGRSIGLIGRGIVKGIGDVWHDRKG